MVGSEANAPGGPGDLQNTTATLVTMLGPRGGVIFIIESQQQAKVVLGSARLVYFFVPRQVQSTVPLPRPIVGPQVQGQLAGHRRRHKQAGGAPICGWF